MTDFADAAVVVPLAIAITISLVLRRWWRGAGAWIVVASASFALMLLLKLIVFTCSRAFLPADIRSPSGHVAGAALVAGAIGQLILNRRDVALVLAASVGLVIGASRFAVGAHTLPEIAIGELVGLVGTGGLIWLTSPRSHQLRPLGVEVILLVLPLLLHGEHLGAEKAIHSASSYLALIFGRCSGSSNRPTPEFSPEHPKIACPLSRAWDCWP